MPSRGQRYESRTEKETMMTIERPLLDILACPIDKRGLLYFDDEAILYNPRLRRIYRMADDHLVMLADRAEPAAEGEHERLLKRAAHGDAVGTAGLVVDEVGAGEGAAGGILRGLSGRLFRALQSQLIRRHAKPR
jgi:uncharacterized protein